MSFEIANFADPSLDVDYLCYLVDQQSAETAERYERLWDYFRNPLLPAMGPSPTRHDTL